MLYKCKITDAEYLMKISKGAEDILSHLPREDEYYVMDAERLDDLQSEIDFAIVGKGMDNMDTVNEVGIHLYEIYDEILWQVTEQRKGQQESLVRKDVDT